ncbi:MAG: hypothetical protein ACFE9R_15270, partial [Candidatus Hermodarchaeota archaeon]
FKINPEFFMKQIYIDFRKRMIKTIGDKKLRALEKHILENFCFYEGENLLYECRGTLTISESFEKTEISKTKHMPVTIAIKDGELFFTNYRIISHGTITLSGGSSTKLFTWDDFLPDPLWIAGTVTRRSAQKSSLNRIIDSGIKSMPLFGYQVPSKNFVGLGKLLNAIWFNINIDNRKYTVAIKPPKSSERDKHLDKIHNTLRTLRPLLEEILDRINYMFELGINKPKRRKYILKILEKSKDFQDLSDSDILTIVKEIYLLDPESFTAEIFPKMLTWNSPTYSRLKDKIEEIISDKGLT